ncbi:MAG: DUF3426 domain-containing protein [Polaromonas sp.]|nr:DUF3426 domain-containing protein [Polaromonas sp.]
MSLITRCPACGTMFKVVADQLKISQGWVRCGQCSDVFDAAAYLQPRELGVPAPAPVSGTTGAPAASAVAEPPAYAPAATPVAALSTLLVAPDNTTAAAPPEPPAPALSVPEVQVSMPPDLAAEVFASSVSPDSYVLPDAAAREAQEDSNFGESAAPPVPVQDVSFVRDARRQAFWRRPVMRWSLGGVGLLLLIGLLLQVALFQRDALAVRQPGLHGGLQALCGYLGCEIGPLRQIESIVIDSSSFSKLAPDAYRLKVVIKNTGSVALAMPALELTLTDSQDQALVRRVLAPAELGADVATLAAGGEFSGVLAIAVSNPAAAPVAAASAPAALPRPSVPLRIAGYRVLAFYP